MVEVLALLCVSLAVFAAILRWYNKYLRRIITVTERDVISEYRKMTFCYADGSTFVLFARHAEINYWLDPARMESITLRQWNTVERIYEEFPSYNFDQWAEMYDPAFITWKDPQIVYRKEEVTDAR